MNCVRCCFCVVPSMYSVGFRRQRPSEDNLKAQLLTKLKSPGVHAVSKACCASSQQKVLPLSSLQWLSCICQHSSDTEALRDKSQNQAWLNRLGRQIQRSVFGRFILSRWDKWKRQDLISFHRVRLLSGLA